MLLDVVTAEFREVSVLFLSMALHKGSMPAARHNPSYTHGGQAPGAERPAGKGRPLLGQPRTLLSRERSHLVAGFGLVWGWFRVVSGPDQVLF